MCHFPDVNRYLWKKNERCEFHCTDIMCQSSWLMWISFFSTEHEIIESALLWLGTRGPAKIIREKRCPSSQVIGNVSWTSVTAVAIWDCLSPMRLSRLEWVRGTLHDIISHGVWYCGSRTWPVRLGENHLLVEPKAWDQAGPNLDQWDFFSYGSFLKSPMTQNESAAQGFKIHTQCDGIKKQKQKTEASWRAQTSRWSKPLLLHIKYVAGIIKYQYYWYQGLFWRIGANVGRNDGDPPHVRSHSIGLRLLRVCNICFSSAEGDSTLTTFNNKSIGPNLGDSGLGITWCGIETNIKSSPSHLIDYSPSLCLLDADLWRYPRANQVQLGEDFFISHLAWECLGIPLKEEVARKTL